ncbi:hypothetical protein ZEAMMB73_Zm00001d051823 [Zea mays]|uniref:Uncharacterized protein n=1 Tax=Zea mays TaxID=4577 RepID=K7UZJ9_MAIZE|nr:hypothetical protein ZEAMMB73_Zm00001d051823 [Zea mays]
MSPSLLLLHSSATPCRGLLPPPSSCFATFSRASSPLRPRHRIRLVCAAEQPNGAASPGSGSGGDATANPTNNGLPKNRRVILLEYVKNVQPEFMELFIKRAPAQVVEAMRQTVTNMMGTLPPQFFAVTVSTVLSTSYSYGCFPNGKFTFCMTFVSFDCCFVTIIFYQNRSLKIWLSLCTVS